jgi:hypothetical protein
MLGTNSAALRHQNNLDTTYATCPTATGQRIFATRSAATKMRCRSIRARLPRLLGRPYQRTGAKLKSSWLRSRTIKCVCRWVPSPAETINDFRDALVNAEALEQSEFHCIRLVPYIARRTPTLALMACRRPNLTNAVCRYHFSSHYSRHF